MMRFILKGVLRDRSRSLFPILIVTVGVALVVVLHAWTNGVLQDLIDANSRFNSGHFKITTRAYAQFEEQIPNDLCLLGLDTLQSELKQKFPDIDWHPRIRFFGLLDIPDSSGETVAQAPVSGLATDLLGPERKFSIQTLKLNKALVEGRLPQAANEILLSHSLFTRLGLQIGQPVTLISSTMFGGLAIYNFEVVGTIQFGLPALDRMFLICDLHDAQLALDMENGCSEIFGYFKNGQFDEHRAAFIKTQFTAAFAADTSQFAPVLHTLFDQAAMADYYRIVKSWIGSILFAFILILSAVLWNSGLMSGLRRYGELGLRLAMGETKGHVYGTLLLESLVTGLIGTILGTLLGLAFAYFLQEKGVNISGMMQNATILLSEVMRARITPMTFFIGFLPGLLSNFLGTALAGRAIYKRQTSQLFKELQI